MNYKPVRYRCCQNEKCQDHGKFGEGNIIRHSKYKTRQGRRRRYLYKTCNKTFCSTMGTPQYRLHKPRSVFDEVVQMTVEGVGISSISRIKCFSWNTIAIWQYLACKAAGMFNDHKLKGVELMEQLLFESEDSSTINTSFIERLNLTIRQGCAYLGRRTACHSRHRTMLADNLALQMCLQFRSATLCPKIQD